MNYPQELNACRAEPGNLTEAIKRCNEVIGEIANALGMKNSSCLSLKKAETAPLPTIRASVRDQLEYLQDIESRLAQIRIEVGELVSLITSDVKN